MKCDRRVGFCGSAALSHTGKYARKTFNAMFTEETIYNLFACSKIENL